MIPGDNATASGIRLVLAAAPLVASTFATSQRGLLVAPGAGNQVHRIAFDPANAGVAHAGGSVRGVYKFTYDADCGSWEPWSEGRGFSDLDKPTAWTICWLCAMAFPNQLV